jgi:hypothetical protein
MTIACILPSLNPAEKLEVQIPFARDEYAMQWVWVLDLSAWQRSKYASCGLKPNHAAIRLAWCRL